jgi:hypothetical protein
MTSHHGQVQEPYGCQLACDAPGVSAQLRPLERQACFKGGALKRRQDVMQGGRGASGNAAARLTFALE